MFAITPHGFAMSHGHPDVRRQATHCVDRVASACEWVLLIMNRLVHLKYKNLTQVKKQLLCVDVEGCSFCLCPTGILFFNIGKLLSLLRYPYTMN
ncbi:hypothetical protein JNUCC42_15445 [Brevibacterium sp. JNUCC-42]|nr:hypothetical protein JNUCC42_15445 [Brevibacterium sp. JNUCC-42]